MSTALMLLLVFLLKLDLMDDSNNSLDHPYVVGVLMTGFFFLLTFRANFAYARVSFRDMCFDEMSVFTTLVFLSIYFFYRGSTGKPRDLSTNFTGSGWMRQSN